LTEVAGFPAFMWAMLGMHYAAVRPSWRSDLLAVLGVALAFFARTQFVGLIAVLPAALLVYHASRRELRSAARRHLLLVCVYVVLAVAAAATVLSGHRLSSPSVYGNLNPGPFPPASAGSLPGPPPDP